MNQLQIRQNRSFLSLEKLYDSIMSSNLPSQMDDSQLLNNRTVIRELLVYMGSRNLTMKELFNRLTQNTANPGRVSMQALNRVIT